MFLAPAIWATPTARTNLSALTLRRGMVVTCIFGSSKATSGEWSSTSQMRYPTNNDDVPCVMHECLSVCELSVLRVSVVRFFYLLSTTETPYLADNKLDTEDRELIDLL